MMTIPGGRWPEGYFQVTRGIHHRHKDFSAFTRSAREASRCHITEDDIVMDIGAHIGGFSHHCVTQGAHVIAIDPDEESMALLERNVPNATHVRAAVTSDGLPNADLWLCAFNASTEMHSLVASKGRRRIRVPVVDFESLIETYRPTVIKVDIEGGEYYLDWDALREQPPRLIHLEQHMMKSNHREQSIDLYDRLLAMGYKSDGAPNFESMFSCTVIYTWNT